MTVTYTAEVATCAGYGCFLHLLRRWRGSIYKLIWMDLIAFLTLYYFCSFLYAYALNDGQQKVFEGIVHYCKSYGSLIPLSFVLGFYINIVMQRWWAQYMTIPWPDPLAVFVSTLMHGQDERGRLMRRTVMRYVCVSLTIVLARMSPRVKKRFPTMDHYVEAGLLIESEKQIIASFDEKFPKHPKHWMPIVWAASIATRARKEGRIRDDFSLKTIIDELNRFRGQCGELMHYDFISIPLVYTQVVTLAVYSYFLCTIMGSQWTKEKDRHGYYNLVDYYFPVFTTLQFFFYMGWLKVAETLINPFGEDDDDFEVSWLIDRNLNVSYLIVDEMHQEHPDLVKDQYWEDVFPDSLPYTKESNNRREEPPEPSTNKVDVFKTSRMSAVSGTTLRGSVLPSMQSNISRFSNTLKSMWSRHETRVPSGSSSEDVNTVMELPPPFRRRMGLNKKSSDIARNANKIGDANDDKQQLIQPKRRPSSIRGSMDTRESIMMHRPRPITRRATGYPEQRYDSQLEETSSDSAIGSKDDFERLIEQREQDRLERQRQSFVRNMTSVLGEEDISTLPSQPSATTPRRDVAFATESQQFRKEAASADSFKTADLYEENEDSDENDKKITREKKKK